MCTIKIHWHFTTNKHIQENLCFTHLKTTSVLQMTMYNNFSCTLRKHRLYIVLVTVVYIHRQIFKLILRNLNQNPSPSIDNI